MNVFLVTHVIAVHHVRIWMDHMYVPVMEDIQATGTLVEMWMSVHSAVITVTAMHNATTFLDLSLANVTTRVATMATALYALFTEASKTR